jgi:hypothetical protein
VVVILKYLSKFIIIIGITACLTGCREINYFEDTTETTTVVDDEVTSEEKSTVHVDIFPQSVYDYDVKDTILVPKE